MPDNKGKRIWITWEYQIRNRSLSRLLFADLYEILEDERSALGRYIVCMWRTFKLVRQERPTWVIHQNPSVFLGLLLVLLRPFYRFKMATDTHNAGLYPAEGKYSTLNWIGRLVTKKTDLLIVHNDLIADFCRGIGADPYVLSDPLPEFPKLANVDVNPHQVVFVCRWSSDEPYEEVVEAFSLLKMNVPEAELFITGKPPKEFLNRDFGAGIYLTGFLEEKEYQRLLFSSAVMVVLTNRTNSLNCGGYEALSLAKPCILFDTPVLRDFFGSSFYYSGLSPKAIALSIRSAIYAEGQTTEAMNNARAAYKAQYNSRIEVISERLNCLTSAEVKGSISKGRY